MAVSHYRFLNAGGEASREIMDFDWASTSLGPIEEWPSVLKTTLALMLRSTFPKALVWGPEFITFHNDAFRPILGEKPPAIGRSFSDVWAEAWDKIEPIALDALASIGSEPDDDSPRELYIQCLGKLQAHINGHVLALENWERTSSAKAGWQKVRRLMAAPAALGEPYFRDVR